MSAISDGVTKVENDSHEDEDGATSARVDADVAPDNDPLLPVQALMKKHKRCATLNAGKATGMGVHGTPVDQTPEGYDRELISWLVHKGNVTDRNILANALNCRADLHARNRGVAYIFAVVDAELARAVQAVPPSRTQSSSFISNYIDAVSMTVYETDEPVYVLTVRGKELRLSSQQLIYRRRFKERHFEVLGEFPTLPDGDDAEQKWQNDVAFMVKTAKKVHAPEESSVSGAIRAAVQRAISQLGIGVEPGDLRRSLALLGHKNGQQVLVFSLDTIMERVVSHDTKPRRGDLAVALDDSGCQYGSIDFTTGNTVVALEPAYYIIPPQALLEDIEKLKSMSPPPESDPTADSHSPDADGRQTQDRDAAKDAAQPGNHRAEPAANADDETY